jgi:hypothetical protein
VLVAFLESAKLGSRRYWINSPAVASNIRAELEAKILRDLKLIANLYRADCSGIADLAVHPPAFLSGRGRTLLILPVTIVRPLPDETIPMPSPGG